MRKKILNISIVLITLILSLYFFFSKQEIKIKDYTINRTFFYISFFIFIFLIASNLLDYYKVSSKTKTLVIQIITFTFVFITLSTNFYNNLLSQFNDLDFKYFSIESDSFVIGKIQNAQISTKTEKSPLLGKYYPTKPININEFTFDFFLNQKTLTSEDYQYYDVYMAQIGAQGTFFTKYSQLLDKLNITNKRQLDFFNLTQSLLLGLMITAIIYWTFLEFGHLAAIFAYFSIIGNYWLVIAGKSIFWTWWVFYLPFVIYAFYFRYVKKENQINLLHILTIIFISVIIKTSFGYEFISTYLIMASLPLFYYAIKYHYHFKNFIKYFLTVIVSSFTSFVLSIGLLFAKLSVAGYSWTEIKKDFNKRLIRTYQGFIYSTNRKPEYDLETSRIDTLKIYFIENKRKMMLNLRAIDFVLILLTITLILLIIRWFRKNKNSKSFGLVAITYLSLLGPISWFTLAKAHSLIHPHIDFITFSMPFTIIFFSLLGYTINEIRKSTLKIYKKLRYS